VENSSGQNGSQLDPTNGAGVRDGFEKAMITSRRLGVTTVHVYYDEQPLGGDLVHHYQQPEPMPGARCVPFWTSIIDLTKTPEQLFLRLDRETRRVIRRVDESGDFRHEFTVSPNAEMIAELSTLQRKFNSLKQLDQDQNDLLEVAASQFLNISFVRDRDGAPLVWRAYYRVNKRIRSFRVGNPRLEVNDTKERQLLGRASRYSWWRDMLASRELGCEVFDLGGWYVGTDNQELLGVNHFKRAFGGDLIQQFNCLRPNSWKGRAALFLQDIRAKAQLDSAESKRQLTT
jgi:hypothetical protein